MAKMGTHPEYLYFDIASMPHSSFTKKGNPKSKKKGNIAKSRNEPVTIIRRKDAETVNEEEENYEFDDITDDEVDDEYILQK